jgi:hypothetical protein
MSEQALATTDQPTRQQLAAQGRSAPGKVTGKLKRALDAMVWEASRRDDAAKAAGMAVHGLREALRKPHVRAYYLAQLDVLRTSERARNIHTLAAVRDQESNQMARVQAVKALEQIGDEAAPGTRQSAGFVIMVVGSPHMSHMRQIEANPLIDNDAGQKDD